MICYSRTEVYEILMVVPGELKRQFSVIPAGHYRQSIAT
jgi:hypothetical protein